MSGSGREARRTARWTSRRPAPTYPPAVPAVAPDLLDLLACPSPDHRPLVAGTEDDPEAPVLRCTGCASTFPVRDGVPVLLVDEATPGPRGLGVVDDGAVA